MTEIWAWKGAGEPCTCFFAEVSAILSFGGVSNKQRSLPAFGFQFSFPLSKGSLGSGWCLLLHSFWAPELLPHQPRRRTRTCRMPTCCWTVASNRSWCCPSSCRTRPVRIQCPSPSWISFLSPNGFFRRKASPTTSLGCSNRLLSWFVRLRLSLWIPDRKTRCPCPWVWWGTAWQKTPYPVCSSVLSSPRWHRRCPDCVSEHVNPKGWFRDR